MTPTDRVRALAARTTDRAGDVEPDAVTFHDLTEAVAQMNALTEAACLSPNLYTRTMLSRLAREWAQASNDLIDVLDTLDSGRVVVASAAALPSGAQVWRPSNGSEWVTLVRVMARDGQVSLHLEGDDGRPVYVNLTSPGSPVVVLA